MIQMSRDSDEDGIRPEQRLAQTYINGSISSVRWQIHADENPANLMLLLIKELGLAYGYEEALGRVQRMMGW
jgi:hypothetical protein